MLRNIVAAVAFACAALTPAPGRAQEPAQMEAMLVALGAWMQEYLTVMTSAVAPFMDMTEYNSAIDSFVAGDASESQARAGIESWRRTALASLSEARNRSGRMGDPPSFATISPDGIRLDTIARRTRESIAPTLAEMESVVHATADLGLAALDDRDKAFEARERAFYQAAIALTRVDRARIDLAAATLSEHHPSRSMAVAAQHYYTSLDVFPRYLLAEFDGAEDRGALVVSLRESAAGMRAAIAEANGRLPPLRLEAERLQRANPDTVRIGRVMQQMIETFPPSFAAFEGLAANIEGAARQIEAGADVGDIWTGLDALDRPFLDETDRLDRLRASLLTDMRR